MGQLLMDEALTRRDGSDRPKPAVMAILNVTPDSFSDGGRYSSAAAAAQQALALIRAGADIVDVGGESTRPGADWIDPSEEIRRTVPVIKALVDLIGEAGLKARISIDTRKPVVAQAAIKAGAHIWNDVSALSYAPDSLDMAARLDCPVILMHAQGTPQTMQDNPYYDDVINEIGRYLTDRADKAQAAGIAKDHIILDPGIGFGKRLGDNLAILQHVPQFRALGYPVLIGASRKSFIGYLDGSDVKARLGGSIASALWSIQAGADIIRVHDVAETVQALKVWQAIDTI